MLNNYEAAKRTTLEKALSAAQEKLSHEKMMVATYNEDKVAGALDACIAIEDLLNNMLPTEEITLSKIMENELSPCEGCRYYQMVPARYRGGFRSTLGCVAGDDDPCPLLIEVYEWRTGEFVTAQIGGKAALLMDGDQSWFEIDIVVNDESHYAQYNEIELRWESGEV